MLRHWGMVLLLLLGWALGLPNYRPIIGVLSKPLAEEYPDIKTEYTEVIEAKYVHFIEAGGGRVFPLSYKSSTEELRDQLQKLNGVLLTGGATELLEYNGTEPIGLSEYSKGAKRIFDLVLEWNQKGTYYPIWATCLGYELLLLLESNNLKLLTHCYNCSNYNAQLEYTAVGLKESRIYNSFSRYQRQYMETEEIIFNNHMWMIDNDTFYANPSLVDKYSIMSYSVSWDRTQQFISAVEHKQYPFYAVQYHPEKWNYEISPAQRVIHTKESVSLGHGFSNFFVSESRKNDNHFSSYAEELKHVVENEHSFYLPQYGYLYFMHKM